MKQKTANQELWIIISILLLICLSTYISTQAFIWTWGSILAGFLLFFGTPIAFLLYTLIAYKIIIKKDSEGRVKKAMGVALLTIVSNYLIPLMLYGIPSYGLGP